MTRPRRFAVLGTPIHHSASPAMHAAAYAALGLPHRYEAVQCVAKTEVAAAVGLMRRGDLEGLNITAPHKESVLDLCDHVAESAREVGAANALVRDGAGRIVAHNTDRQALVTELRRLRPGLGSAIVLGAGGAALAAVAACRDLGVRLVTVTTRSWTGSEALESSEKAQAFRDRGALLTVWPAHEITATSRLSATMRGAWQETVERCDLVIQATSARGEGPARVVPWRKLPAHAVAYDVTYGSLSPFVARARDSDHVADDGVGMLVEQGAIAFRMWLGIEPPRDVMREAVLARLRHA